MRITENDIHEDFKKYILEYFEQDFMEKHPERKCTLLLTIEGLKVNAVVYYTPNENVDQKIKDELSMKKRSWYNSLENDFKVYMKNPSTEFPNEEWRMECYGSHLINIDYDKYISLEKQWKALNRDKRINEIFS